MYESEILEYSNSEFTPWRLPAARFGGFCFQSPVKFLSEEESSCIQNVASKCATELNINSYSSLALDKLGEQDENSVVTPILKCTDSSGNAVTPCPTASYAGGVCSNAASELSFSMSFDANGIEAVNLTAIIENISTAKVWMLIVETKSYVSFFVTNFNFWESLSS